MKNWIFRLSAKLIFFLCLISVYSAKAQQGVGINTTGASASPSAMLDVNSSNKGLLIPRVSLASTTDVTTIPSPAVSLLVYNTNPSMTGGAEGFWYFNGTNWVQALGPQGIQGPVGATGPQGLQGIQGIQGIQGTVGATGGTGAAGPQGPQGNVGATGAQGPQGIQGPTGPQGLQGIQGVNGNTGATGAQGPQGNVGATGAQGPQGIQGPTGPQGLQGIQGVNGNTGATGPQGPQGNVGATGATGPLVSGTSGQTLRHDGTTWVANSTLYNNGTNVGIGTTAPTQKLDVTGNTKVSGYVVAGSATTGSTTRYGKQTFTNNSTLTNANTDNYGYSGSIGTITIPTGASSVTITKITWECDGAHDDGNEEHGIWVGVGSSAAGASYYGWWAEVNNGYHYIDWHWIGTMSQTVSSGSNYVYIRTYDEYPTLGGSDYLYVYNMKVTVYYQYSIGLQTGDIAASGRIYANNTTAVGDLAEHLEYKGFVEPGIVVAYVPGSDNEYVQCNEPYSDHIAGVISENPSVVLNSSQQGPPVALAGRVKVKLVAADQLIKGGDFITSSAVAGLGQKATQPEPVIGYAVKNQNPGDDFVEILLQPGKYYVPKSYINSQLNDDENKQGEKPKGKW